MSIVLSTLNARYAHSAFGLRYLLANMGELAEQTRLIEFHIQQNPLDCAERILAERPRIVGLGVYIWNAETTLRLVRVLKKLAPEVVVVLGGPEVSHEADDQEICRWADHVIAGEADLAFAELCRAILAGHPAEKMIRASLPPLDAIALPYHLYSDEDLRQRVVYVEASRGCPFRCEFCLSSLDVSVRAFDLGRFLAAMDDLLRRGARRLKFVDRTFNLNIATGRAILEHFLPWKDGGLFLHFEVIPDRLPDALREVIARFPPGVLQFEVGVQTFNPQAAERISRRQDNARVEENLRWLRQHTGVHVHTDLIAGLPGEDWGSFAAGFDRLVGLGPHEIQIEVLKRLRGTPIVRHDAAFDLRFDPAPPYELLSNSTLSAAQLQRLRRFSRYWDATANSGRFRETLPLLLGDTPFDRFMAWSDWLWARLGRAHGIDALELGRLLLEHLSSSGHPAVTAAERLWSDLQRWPLRDCPDYLRPHIAESRWRNASPPRRQDLPPRQRLHVD